MKALAWANTASILLLLAWPVMSVAQDDTLSEQTRKRQEEKTRGEILAELQEAKRGFERSPEDPGNRFTYGQLLFQSGEFWRAREVITPLADAEPSYEALSLVAKLAYLTADYSEAEKLYDRLIEATEADVQAQVMAKVGQMFTYYQQDRFDKIKAIDFPSGVQLPNATLAGVFDENPYRLEWHNDEKVSIVPFIATDPLPVFTIEVNGIPLQVLFDTGGDLLIIDDEVAEAMGIESVASVMGSFGGGRQAEIGFGKVDRVKLGGVTMHNVPVMILATKRFSFEPEKHILSGIIGTATMRQFLGTVDYQNERLVLRERSEENGRRLRDELKGAIAAEIPFVLDATHLMMARGSLNDKDGLTFFMDSGLASDAMFTAPIQTLEYVGIPVPETAIPEEGGGGGGGKWARGFFTIASVGLGSLVQTDTKGEYGSRPPESYWAQGYIQDGLLSHRFLRQYASWTLDFDSMTYIFER